MRCTACAGSAAGMYESRHRSARRAFRFARFILFGHYALWGKAIWYSAAFSLYSIALGKLVFWTVSELGVPNEKHFALSLALGSVFAVFAIWHYWVFSKEWEMTSLCMIGAGIVYWGEYDFEHTALDQFWWRAWSIAVVWLGFFFLFRVLSSSDAYHKESVRHRLRTSVHA